VGIRVPNSSNNRNAASLLKLDMTIAEREEALKKFPFVRRPRQPEEQ
jgi:hypothetical protein